jgi:hypothetical protein
MAKRSVKKNPASKKAKAKSSRKKKMAKAKTARKTTRRSTALRASLTAAPPRKEDVPGYSTGVRDYARWPDVAIVLKARPFYTGPDSAPFSRLRARLIPDPTRGNQPANDFYLDHG